MNRLERLALYVALTAMTAFAIDGVMPAMVMIEEALVPVPPSTVAQIMTFFILGMAIGELVFGPLSDAVGRRPAVLTGLVLFIVGSIVAATAESFLAVVLGRLLQGIGVAGPKIGTRAMIRDRYAGAEMAKILSLMFGLLMFVPMIAPLLGAAIAAASGWRGLFWSYLVLASLFGMWLYFRHPETLLPEARIPLKPGQLARNIVTILKRMDVTPIVIATGFVFGANLVYFSVAAEMFANLYGYKAFMPALFALLATGIGCALFINARLVGRTGMEAPIVAGLLLEFISGVGLLVACMISGGQPPIAVLLILAWVGFFSLGLLFGNLNAFAMRPLGDLAGLGSSITAAGSSFVSFVFATAMEMMFDQPVWAFASAFAFSALLSACCILPVLPTGPGRKLLRTFRFS